MNNKIKKFIELAQIALGEHCFGVTDNSVVDGQIAFLTDEPDQGEYVRGKWLDVLENASREIGLAQTIIMPFPVNGSLVYVAAGLN